MENNDKIEDLENTSEFVGNTDIDNIDQKLDNTKSMPTIIDSELISETLEIYDEENEEVTSNDTLEEPFEEIIESNTNSQSNEENNNAVTQDITNDNLEEPFEEVIDSDTSYQSTEENNSLLESETNNTVDVADNNNIINPSNDYNTNIFGTNYEVNNPMESVPETDDNNINNEPDNTGLDINISSDNNQTVTVTEEINNTIPTSDNNISNDLLIPNNNPLIQNTSEITKQSTAINLDNSNGKHPKYIGYEFRICIRLVSAIMLFLVAGVLLVISAKTYQKSEVTYNEASTIDYKVCLDENEHYKEECLNSGMEYLSTITKNIPVTFTYNALYTSEVDYDLKYYIKSTLKITKPEEENKVLYTSDETLLKKQKLKGKANVVTISENIEIPFKKYNDYVNEYNNKYSLNSDSHVDVELYLEENNKKKKIAKVTVPLSVQTFNVAKEEVSNNHLSVESSKEHYKKLSQIYSIIACILCLIGIIVIIRLVLYILKSISKKSEYETKLNQILKEYDRIIVQVENGSEFIGNKRIIKVSSFLELLDARDTLEKPIVHVRVNNIKSEFYVEDIDKAYKYTMKESDFTKK